jgi:hypothetical protein
MDLEDIARRQRAAREFTHPVGGAQFTLRILTAHERRCELMRLVELPPPSADGAPAPRELTGAQLELLTRRVTERSIVGWDGVTVAHLLPADPAAPADAVPWSEQAVPLLLDAQPDWERALRAAIAQRSVPRADAEEADAKN